jgi:phospholipase/carboxylesterase
MIEQLETVEVKTGPDPLASVIWLHGLGADGHDFEPIVPELDLPRAPAVRFVFPHAPVRPVTINAGLPMRAWFDILGLDRRLRQDEAGVRDSAARIGALLEREEIERGVDPGRIVLAGFSQGGAMALHVGLRYPRKLAGIMALSCFLPLADRLQAERSAAAADVPVFLAHGRYDPVLPMELGAAARELLEDLGLAVEWRDYAMPHAVCPEEIFDIARWLKRVLE